jgi:transcriptional regulator with XRE-family HTH domain
MTPAQCRAARAILRWTQDELASKSQVSSLTLRNFETEKADVRPGTVTLIARALQEAGIEFIPGGARVREQAAEASAS